MRERTAGGGDGLDPVVGPDGTEPPRPRSGADDETAWIPRPTGDPTAGRVVPSDLRLPPAGGDTAALARWMDADRERSLVVRDPSTDARDVPPPRRLRPQRPERVLPPETVVAPEPRSPEGPPDEPAWRRERREEAEFAAEFGEWRAGRAGGRGAGGGRPGRSSGGFLGGVRISAPLLVLIAILVAVVALTFGL